MSSSCSSKMKYFILTIFLIAQSLAQEEETTTDGFETTIDGTEEPEVCQGGIYTNVWA